MRKCTEIFHKTNVNVYSLTFWNSVSQFKKKETVQYFLNVFKTKKMLPLGLLPDIEILKKSFWQ